MAEERREVVSEEEAAAIWRRAARLQMEAAQRLEERSRSLGVAADHGLPRTRGLRQEELEEAAVEAGISREFVQLAQAELKLVAGSAEATEGWGSRFASRVLGLRQRSIEASRMIVAPAEDVLAAMRRILPHHPYNLSLRDSLGGHPTSGGVLVFALPELGMSSATATPLTVNATAVDLKQLLLRLVPSEDGHATEVILTGDLHFGIGLAGRVGTGMAGAGAAIGAGAGLGAAAKALAITGGMMAFPAAVGAAALGSLGAWGYGAIYRGYLRKLLRTLEDLLQALDVDARTAGAFAPAGPNEGLPPRLKPTSGE